MSRARKTAAKDAPAPAERQDAQPKDQRPLWEPEGDEAYELLRVRGVLQTAIAACGSMCPSGPETDEMWDLRVTLETAAEMLGQCIERLKAARE